MHRDFIDKRAQQSFELEAVKVGVAWLTCSIQGYFDGASVCHTASSWCRACVHGYLVVSRCFRVGLSGEVYSVQQLTSLMAWMLDEWEPRLRQRKRKSRRPVSHKWLKEPVPDPDLVVETEKARNLVADASLEECLEELVSTRQDGRLAGPTRKLDQQWSSLLSRARRQVLSSVEKEFGPSGKLQPLHPSPEVKDKFFTARRTFESTTTFTYHGTKAANIDSISRVGLLMPGKNGHKVANGSAHGVGIYTAQLGKATLSKGFCDSNKMFVCAVCDTSQPITEEETASKLPCFHWCGTFGCCTLPVVVVLVWRVVEFMQRRVEQRSVCLGFGFRVKVVIYIYICIDAEKFNVFFIKVSFVHIYILHVSI